jgi:hypothetical protein
MWFLRLSHTRLADSIMDLCGVPAKDAARRACLSMFTQLTAPCPSHLSGFSPLRRKRSNSKSQMEPTKNEVLDERLSDAVTNDGLPQQAANKLRLVITNGCLPLSPDIDKALDSLHGAITQLRQTFDMSIVDPRRLKRFDDVARSIKGIRSLMQSLSSVGAGPLLGDETAKRTDRLNRPLYISLDLGLRQRRKHYHGQLLFQCISIPDIFFDSPPGDNAGETNETILSPSGGCFKIAEGGRYDELVSNVESLFWPWFLSHGLLICVFFRCDDIALQETLDRPCSTITQRRRFRW